MHKLYQRVELEVYNAGYMGMQIGANEKQSLYMNFEEVTCRTLALREADGQNRINLCSQHSASVAIGKVDDAIAKALQCAQNLVHMRTVLKVPYPVLMWQVIILLILCHV